MEIFCWTLLALLNPVTDCITMLTAHWASCIVAMVVGGLIFPLYLLYARFVGALFLDHRRRILTWLLSIGSFFIIQLCIFSLYALMRAFRLYPEQQAWASFNTLTIIRVSWWVAVNMSLTVGILFIGKSLDEKSQVEHFRKESGFFPAALSPGTAQSAFPVQHPEQRLFPGHAKIGSGAGSSGQIGGYHAIPDL